MNMTPPSSAEKSEGAALETEESAQGSFTERFYLFAWLMLGLVVFSVIYGRWGAEELPNDLSAYIAGAEAFLAGLNPYGPQLEETAAYAGYVYVYPPGTLPLVSILGFLPARPLALIEPLLHVGALVLALAWLRRYFSISMPLGWLSALVCALYIPAVTDIVVGNVVAYMFLAWIGCVWLSEQEAGRPSHVALAVILGLILAFKPMWGAPAGLILLVRRRWALAGGLLAGASVVAILSFIPWHGEVLVGSWLARLEAIRQYYKAGDLPTVAPALYWPAVLLWASAGALLIRRLGAAHPHLWLWAATSLVVWPRLGMYSYILSLPLIFYCWQRKGPRFALLVSLPVPLGWFLLVLLDAPAITYQWGYLLGLYVWASALTLIVFILLWGEEPAKSAGSGSAMEGIEPIVTNA